MAPANDCRQNFLFQRSNRLTRPIRIPSHRTNRKDQDSPDYATRRKEKLRAPLETSSYAFLRHDAIWNHLQSPYGGQYQFIPRKKIHLIDCNWQQKRYSTPRPSEIRISIFKYIFTYIFNLYYNTYVGLALRFELGLRAWNESPLALDVIIMQ